MQFIKQFGGRVQLLCGLDRNVFASVNILVDVLHGLFVAGVVAHDDIELFGKLAKLLGRIFRFQNCLLACNIA